MKSRKTIEKMIDGYLKERKECVDGRFAPVTPAEIFRLGEIIMALLERKYETDAYNDLPVDFHLADRTRLAPSRWISVPHIHLATTTRERLDILAQMAGNVERASDALKAAAMVAGRAEDAAKGKP